MLLVGLLLVGPPGLGSATPHSGDGALLGCPEAESLPELFSCLKKRMPGRDSEGYDGPSDEERRAFFLRSLLMLEIGCRVPVAPLPPLDDHWLVPFHDQERDRTYCVYAEVPEPGEEKVSRGLGAFVVPQGPAARNVHVQVAHPLHDLGTLEQGVGVFQGLDGGSLLVAGAHRAANANPSACQPGYLEADVAHCDRSAFQAATEAVLEHHKLKDSSFAVLQFHGMTASSCPATDVHLTDGTADPPADGSLLARLRDEMRDEHPDWTVTAPGDGSVCPLQGTWNVQGRLLNGVPEESVCDEAANDAIGRFLHVEQGPGYRFPEDWSGALARAWDAGPST